MMGRIRKTGVFKATSEGVSEGVTAGKSVESTENDDLTRERLESQQRD